MKSDIRVAIYARVSSEAQVIKSGLDVQVAACRAYASEMGYQVHEVYQDEGVSGAHGVRFRDGLDRMLTDAKLGRFHILLVHELDRLARELFVGLSIVGLVAESRTQLLEVSTRTLFDDHGALMGLVKLWGAGEDRKRILRRTKQGHIERAKRGKVSGPAPLGYDRDSEGFLVINHEEAELVRRIFHLYLNEGYNLDSLATLLNTEGVKTKRAKLNEAGKNRFRGANHWQRSTIQCVLKNPVYKGTYVYGKTQGRVRAGEEYTGNPKRPLQKAYLETAVKNRALLPHEQVEVPVPPIVDEELWQSVQAQLADRASRTTIRKGATKYSYRFEGIVRCHHCGRLMTRMTMTRQNKDGRVKRMPYYTCRNQENACPNVHKHHPLDQVDRDILQRLLPYLENPGLIREGLAIELEKKEKSHTGLTARSRILEDRVAKLGIQKQRLLDIYLDGAITSQEFKTKSGSLDAELEKHRQDLSEAQEQLKELALDDDYQKAELVIQFFTALQSQATTPDAMWQWAITHSDDPEEIAVSDDEFLMPDLDGEQPTVVKLAQTLLKRVTINRESQIEDYVLRIKMEPPPDETGGGEAGSYIANLKCITSPSFTS